MGKLVVGSMVAAVVMFLLGFVLYGTLFWVGWATASEDTTLALQQALKALPRSGTYVIPMGETPTMMAAYAAGPIAQISYHAGGGAMMDPAVFAGGFFHMAVTAFLFGLLLWNLRDRLPDFAKRAELVLGAAAIAVVYIELADPIWYRGDWRHAIWTAICDFIILGAAGLIQARWFVPGAAETPATLAG